MIWLPGVAHSQSLSPTSIPSGTTKFVSVSPLGSFTPGQSILANSISTSSYAWRGSQTVYYGYCDIFGACTTIGSFQESWTANLNGRQVQLSQKSTVLTGPELEMTQNWQCWNNVSGSLCASIPNSVNWAFGFTSGVVGYSYASTNADTFSYLPSANGTFHITFNWNWAALGFPNPNTFNGRYHATPLISPPISCSSANTSTCQFI
jgi:hypothetical protein